MNWLKNLINFILYWFKQAQDSKPIPDPVTPPVVNPPPNPPPVTGTIILFDLPQTAVDMFQAGFPGSEGELLYSLGQIANGWDVGQSPGHEILFEYSFAGSLRGKLEIWYDKRISEIIEKLKINPGFSLIIIANDQKDRFGCRIGPPTYERLKDFGDRVQMGYFVPESEY